MTPTHTPGPWKAVKSSQFDEAEIVVGSGDAIGLMYCSDGADEAISFPGRANAERIVACVNACAGMTDPQAEITALREALMAIRDQTYTDAEGPELRAQNECNHRRAVAALRVSPEGAQP